MAELRLTRNYFPLTAVLHSRVVKGSSLHRVDIEAVITSREAKHEDGPREQPSAKLVMIGRNAYTPIVPVVLPKPERPLGSVDPITGAKHFAGC